MIVPNTPRVRLMIKEVWRPLTVLFVWDVIVTVTYFVLPFKAPSLPLTLFGSAIALFLGFRVNSAYERWWEGRGLWGLMINASRSLARSTIAFLDDKDPGVVDLKRTIVLRQIAYVHALRNRLRKEDPAPEVLRMLSPEEAKEGLDRQNVPNGLLDGTARRIAEAQRRGLIDTIQQTQLERVLVDIANAQGGMERLKNTPLPMQYRFFPEIFARLFCVALPIGLVESLGWATPAGSTVAGLMFLAILRIGDDLVDPFANDVHDVPLTGMCRTVEIDLLEAIGDEAPKPLQPEKGVLW
ncbi:bestrophin family protein [Sphingomonas prati]|uniref:Putative membrane protein n=1 Tax=Sphingomonas prati TaxID=1843237 RepID=A0A7W9BQ78_9SPHN|nr:bestrophin family protein [Sphingomonas prati]MBB5727628.1 putative membrane protein [Sphingomonas prati]GGE79510.1 membrane protein [Sphingomonas prati]